MQRIAGVSDGVMGAVFGRVVMIVRIYKQRTQQEAN